MSGLSQIRNLVVSIRLKLIEHSADTGVTVDDPEFTRKIEELNRMNQSLALAIRNLKTAEHAAIAREKNLWKIPREQRYAPTASVKDQQREIAELFNEVRDIQRMAEELAWRIYSGSEMEGFETLAKGVQGGAELIKQLTSHEDVTAEQPLPDRPTYVPSGQVHAVSLETAVTMGYVAIRGLYLLFHKRKKK